MLRKTAFWALVGGSAAWVPFAGAGITADSVVNYTPGTVVNSYWGAPYTNSSAALGAPNPTQQVPDLFDASNNQIAFADNSAITQFNASYNPANVVAIQNAGGMLTLHLSSPITIGAGATIGVHSGAGLQDASFPNGQNLTPAQNYTDPRVADLQVGDGTNWVDLGTKSFNNPTNIYTDATDPTGATPGKTLADFSKPFLGTVSSFDGKDFAGTLATLNGSGGGTWFDLSSVGLAQIDEVRFTTGDGEKLFVDAVVGDSAASSNPTPPPVTTPSAVPLPSAAAMALALVPFLAVVAVRHRRAAW